MIQFIRVNLESFFCPSFRFDPHNPTFSFCPHSRVNMQPYIFLQSQDKKVMRMHRFGRHHQQEDYPRLVRCHDCRGIHDDPNRCKILCQYCHDFHLRKDLINNMCPLMYPLAKQLQQKNSYQCKNCLGEGAFYEQVETVKYESTKKYDEKLKEWSQSIKKDPNSNQPKPNRKILHKTVEQKQINCQDCKGSGLIMRMITCCSTGCANCRGDKRIINPIWKMYRKEPIINDELFQCSICLADVEPETQKFVLHCRHEFHPECIFRWMKQSKKCPVCRQKDIYLEGENFNIGDRQPIQNILEPYALRPLSPMNSENDMYSIGPGDSWIQ